MMTAFSSQIAAAAAASSTPSPTTVAAVKTAIARSARVMLMIDHAVTPAAASRICRGAELAGTASANAAAIGHERRHRQRGGQPRRTRAGEQAASTVNTATPLAANSPAFRRRCARCTADNAVAIEDQTDDRDSRRRARCGDAPQGFSRAAEKMTAASPMSSTIRGAGGPTGTGCSASRSPSTTPTVSSVASRLKGAPPTGASYSDTGDAFGVVGQATPSAAPRAGSRAAAVRSGSAMSVTRPPSSPAASTATRTIGIAAKDVVPVN